MMPVDPPVPPHRPVGGSEGDHHRAPFATFGTVPAVAASTGTSEDVEALAKVLANHQVIHHSIEGPNTSCSGCGWATFTPFGSSAIIAHQAHLATLLAAREAAARAEEREAAGKALREVADDLRAASLGGTAAAVDRRAARIAREGR